MNVLEKLHKIEERKCVYNIHYCKAGVGFCFYEEDKDTGDWRESWGEALVTRGYHESFEEAVEAEYKKLKMCKICGQEKGTGLHCGKLICRNCHLLENSGGRFGVKNMIEIKHLVAFLREKHIDVIITTPSGRKYKHEIVARLRELEKLKKEIKSGQVK